MASNPSSRRAAPDRHMRTFPAGGRRAAEHPQTALASRHFVERRLPWLRYTAEIFTGSSVRFPKSPTFRQFRNDLLRAHDYCSAQLIDQINFTSIFSSRPLATVRCTASSVLRNWSRTSPRGCTSFIRKSRFLPIHSAGSRLRHEPAGGGGQGNSIPSHTPGAVGVSGLANSLDGPLFTSLASV